MFLDLSVSTVEAWPCLLIVDPGLGRCFSASKVFFRGDISKSAEASACNKSGFTSFSNLTRRLS